MREHVDVLIVGAGISGIGMAVHLQRECPGKTFRLIEQRGNVGGTWDLFRYPGVRSDSDMYTLGFDFEPWTHESAIAKGAIILEYLNRIVDDNGVRDVISFNTKVERAEWSTADARWTLSCTGPDGSTDTHTANFLYMGSGYYDHDAGFDAGFKGQKSFKGTIVHPQFWPHDLDYSGKRVVVIGSGATAATIVPSMADQSEGRGAAHVTMLQRTPGWFMSVPKRDRLARLLRKALPARWAYAVVRFKNTQMQDFFYRRARARPAEIAALLTKRVKAGVGDKYDAATFTPPYHPWEQRLCFIPDGDFFEAIKAGTADIVTDHVDRFDAAGIKLASGRHLDADIIVTATGLKLATAGKVAMAVDGTPVVWNQHYLYKGCMFSGIPNMATVLGYPATGWTLKTDLVGHYVCRLLDHMDRSGFSIATPIIDAADKLGAPGTFDLKSNYIQRSIDELPRGGARPPWQLNQSYLADRPVMLQEPVADGLLVFSNPATDVVPVPTKLRVSQKSRPRLLVPAE